jgi:hypothetical protein
VQRRAGLDMHVVLDVDGVAEQGPSVAVVVLDVVPGVEEVPQLRHVFLLDREMSGRPCHGGSLLGRAGRSAEATVVAGGRARAAPAQVDHVAADCGVGDACHPVLGDQRAHDARHGAPAVVVCLDHVTDQVLEGSSRDLRGGSGLRGAPLLQPPA